MKSVTSHVAGPSADEATDSATTDNHDHSRPYLNVENEDSHTFVGEACSIHLLRLAEAKLDQLGLPIRSDSPLPPGRPLTPMSNAVSSPNLDKGTRSWLRTILCSHGVVPDKRQWEIFSRVYLDEIHCIYPLLHPPTVRQTYDYLWERSFLVLPTDLEKDGQSMISIAIVFLCLALGRCLVSSRAANADAAQSAGWSLYSVAMHLLHDFLDMTQDHPMTLNGLQAYGLMESFFFSLVIYLFRLDAKEKADRALANVISGAHVLGLHRKAVYSQMGIFQNEMFARMWWCLYAFDRRLSLGSGRPPIIQDVDYDTQHPRNLGDVWLEQHKSTRATAAELEDEIKAEILITRNTPIPYLEATISFSKVSGDVWKAVYGLHAANRGTPGIVHGYLDLLLENWRQSLSTRLRYEADRSYEDQFSGLEWWQVKECLFSHMRYMFLKLQIRRPVVASTSSATTAHEGIANESARAQLACSILQFFREIPDDYPKYVFSLMDYMISATIVLVAVVVQNAGFKDKYRNVIVAAIQSIALYCRKTWVSGKTIRVISRLDRMVRNTFGP
ncbi:fungal-specific transcription factor domain-containing protein, partial [Ilyonectria sp. MPI-CAGE-AT-0026]